MLPPAPVFGVVLAAVALDQRVAILGQRVLRKPQSPGAVVFDANDEAFFPCAPFERRAFGRRSIRPDSVVSIVFECVVDGELGFPRHFTLGMIRTAGTWCEGEMPTHVVTPSNSLSSTRR
uniref:Putative secreted protein n=1 Tax=Ixodes ricinus TaxID=34613 RepID=A0A6B0UMF2_IXORI